MNFLSRRIERPDGGQATGAGIRDRLLLDTCQGSPPQQFVGVTGPIDSRWSGAVGPAEPTGDRDFCARHRRSIVEHGEDRHDVVLTQRLGGHRFGDRRQRRFDWG